MHKASNLKPFFFVVPAFSVLFSSIFGLWSQNKNRYGEQKLTLGPVSRNQSI